MPEFETLLFSKDDGIAWVSLNRPQVRNAINMKMQEELRGLWHDLRYDEEQDTSTLGRPETDDEEPS